MKLACYSNASSSGKALAEALGVKRLRHHGRRINLRNQLIICWGNARDVVADRVGHFGRALNFNTSTATNKILALEAMDANGVRVPTWTTHAPNINKDEHTLWFARKSLTGNSGHGIIPFYSDEPIPLAPLYTKYVPKRDEYRVHVFDGEAIRVQRKARNLDVPDDEVDWQIRNHSNGFVFVTGDVELPQEALDLAVRAVDACELDFGAVDLIHNTRRGFYVLEVNAAPGLCGSTLDAYVNAINKYKEELGFD